MPTITQDRMESAMEFLAESDEIYAQEKMELERSEILRKRCRSRVFLTVDGTVAEKQAKAEVALEVQAADDAYIACVKAFEEVKAKRQRAELVIEVWRSLNASMRRT